VPGWCANIYVNSCHEAAYDSFVVKGEPVPTDEAPVEGSPVEDLASDGLACVACGAEFTGSGVAQVPVGRSESGSQVFAHAGECEELFARRETVRKAVIAAGGEA
jgi:hypothetical protein